MNFRNLDEAQKWLSSVGGWFTTGPLGTDDDQGAVTAHENRGASRKGFFDNELKGEVREREIRRAKLEACQELYNYLNSEA